MNKKNYRTFIPIFFIFSMMLTFPTDTSASRQNDVTREDTTAVSETEEGEPLPLNQVEKQAIIETISENYYEWDAISMSGKLSSDMLPITASVKIYMEWNKLTVISVSAPLFGEVARIEMDREKVIAVNKMKSKYSTVLMEDIEPMVPGGLEAIQNMLLGRVTILNSGELNKEDTDKLEIYTAENGDLILLPNQDLENAQYVYYYLLNPATLQLDNFEVMGYGMQMDCAYSWGKKKEEKEMNFVALAGDKRMSMTLKLNQADSTPKKISRMDLTGKLREVEPKDLMK